MRLADRRARSTGGFGREQDEKKLYSKGKRTRRQKRGPENERTRQEDNRTRGLKDQGARTARTGMADDQEMEKP